MASSLILRHSARLTASSWSATAARSFSTTSASLKDTKIMDTYDHATGVEKYELEAKQAGNDDPFFMKAIARSAGTKENPTIINALENYRMVGCHCQEGDTNIKWMWVYENKPKRCECGYWFKLKQHEAPEYANMPL